MLIDIYLPFEWCKDCPAMDLRSVRGASDGVISLWHTCNNNDLCRQVYTAVVRKKKMEGNDE